MSIFKVALNQLRAAVENESDSMFVGNARTNMEIYRPQQSISVYTNRNQTAQLLLLILLMLFTLLACHNSVHTD